MSVSAQQGYHPEVSDGKVFCVPMLSPQNTIPSWKMAGNDFPRQFLIKNSHLAGKKITIKTDDISTRKQAASK